MTKSNLILTTLILTGIIILSVNTGLCVEDIAQHVPDTANAAATATSTAIPAKTAIGFDGAVTKFFITMMGVLVASIVIWGGLTIYNKIFVLPNLRQKIPAEEELQTPKTVEDAVSLFIKRNKLK